jgi:hypothetical protein
MAPVRYRISVRGRLTERLGSAFDDMILEPGAGQTVLVGEIRDQHDRSTSYASIIPPARPRTHPNARRPTLRRLIPNRDGACSATAS